MKNIDQATFAAGCFWGIENKFAKTPGVLSTEVGYSGGTKTNPTYEEVCRGDTGHAESVRVEFDPNIISYAQLLDTFWEMHDPTLLNRQGPDIGEQYRSAIFYHDDDQMKIAQQSKKTWEENHPGRKIMTEITRVGPFYRAEEYHQKYIDKKHKF